MYKSFLWIKGQIETSESVVPSKSPDDGSLVTECYHASADQIERCLSSLREAQKAWKTTTIELRQTLLRNLAQEISNHRNEFLERIINESGKPKTLADAEITRAIYTLQATADYGFQEIIEKKRIEKSNKQQAIVRKIPRGPVLAITPFNFPLNLVVHKIAPALMSGNVVVLKPAPQTTAVAELLSKIFHELLNEMSRASETIPKGILQVLHVANERVEQLIKSEAFSTVSFTGSDRVGWSILGHAKAKKVLLELGGNAPVIVEDCDDVGFVAKRIAFGAFAFAGQSCISVQRIYVQSKLYEGLRKALVEEARTMHVGNLNDEKIICGPVVNETAAMRIESLIKEACQNGAKIAIGGKQKATRIIEPTILENVQQNERILNEEVFGPVCILERYEKFEEVIGKCSSSRYAIHAGVFTNDQSKVDHAVANLEYAGILINDIPTTRYDDLPYGGMKHSGLGREGGRMAVDEYCDLQVIIKS